MVCDIGVDYDSVFVFCTCIECKNSIIALFYSISVIPVLACFVELYSVLEVERNRCGSFGASRY